MKTTGVRGTVLYKRRNNEITADLNSNYGSQNTVEHLLVWGKQPANPESIQAKISFKNEVKIEILSNKQNVNSSRQYRKY